jgi:hypothetical protein
MAYEIIDNYFSSADDEDVMVPSEQFAFDQVDSSWIILIMDVLFRLVRTFPRADFPSNKQRSSTEMASR